MRRSGRTTRWTAAVLGASAIAALALAGCGTPLGPCIEERVELELAGSLQADGETIALATTDAVTEQNVGTAPYEALRGFLAEETPDAGEGVVWTAAPFDGNGDFLAVALAGPIEAGDTLAVAGTYGGGTGAGWGVATLPGGVRAQLSLRRGAFTATAASGTIEVLGVEPLRLRLDVTTSAGSATQRLTGTVDFARIRERGPCT